MPNIMLTYRCNLHCSYCFANEFVNKEKTDISIKDFLQAVSFIVRDGTYEIGLIGGEPTLHPGFQVIMDLLISNPKIKQITLFTNGLLMDQFIPQIIHPKVRTLVNCNSPFVIGEHAFTRLRNNLDMILQQYETNGRIKLSINLYSDDMDYSYIIDLLQRNHMDRVRFSLTVPDFSSCTGENVMESFLKRKAFLMKFYRSMDSIKVLPYSDCNHPPYCIWNEEEKEWLRAYTAKYPDIYSNLALPYSRCIPAIDILPNLQAVRCFGMSDYLKVPIADFQNIADLTDFFKNRIDTVACKLSASEKCTECYEQKTGRCFAGCIGYKTTRIKAATEAVNQI